MAKNFVPFKMQSYENFHKIVTFKPDKFRLVAK